MGVNIHTKGWEGEDLVLEITPDAGMNHDNIKVRSGGKVLYALHLGKDSISIHDWSKRKPKLVDIEFNSRVHIEDKVYTVK